MYLSIVKGMLYSCNLGKNLNFQPDSCSVDVFLEYYYNSLVVKATWTFSKIENKHNGVIKFYDVAAKHSGAN